MIGNMIGNYKITDKIGEGGMGAVFKGVDIMLEREVAIKMLRPELASQPLVVERFRAEAVTLAKLNHPNIATLYTFLRQRNDYFMVMEFVPGQTLDSVIRTSGAIPVGQAIPLFCQALEGIDRAHRMGIIHRDIKPANLMLTDEGSIKVMDFGIARVLGSARMTRQGSVVGTIEYMSPEQVRGLEADTRSDVYSMGIVLYEMLTGRVPFSSTSEFDLMKAQIEEAPPPPRTFASHIPLPVEQVIMRALAKKPEARFQTAGEFRATLLDKLATITNAISHAPTGIVESTSHQPNQTINRPESSQALKETRLASGVANPSGFAESPAQIPAAMGAPLKETRLSQAQNFQPMYGQSEPSSGSPPQFNQRQASLFGRLNWQHYTAAAVAVAVLISAAIVLIGFRSKQAITNPPIPPPTEAGTDSTSDPPPQQGNAQSADQETSSPDKPIIKPLDDTPLIKPLEGTPSPRSKPSGPRNPQRDASKLPSPPEETPRQPAPSPPPRVTAPTPPPTVAAPPPPREAPSAKVQEKKNTEKKKSGGFFGAIKKIFGVDSEKKEKKKP